MKVYLDLVRDVLENGKPADTDFRSDRTGVGTYSVFGRQLRFHLADGFPLLTTKKVHLKSIIHELIWFLNGDTNVKYLNDQGVSIWDEWADENGDLGPVYGKQWRNWEGPTGKTDQIQRCINLLKNDPYSRRNIILGFNPSDQPKVAPQGCHTLIQLYLTGNKLSMQLYQRSADLMLGVPFNIASYALLLKMIAQVTGYEAHEFIHTFGDVHIYSNHLDGVHEQLKRTPRSLPGIEINPEVKDIFSFKFEDFKITDYYPDPAIKFPIAV